jgi:hypothetical protein
MRDPDLKTNGSSVALAAAHSFFSGAFVAVKPNFSTSSRAAAWGEVEGFLLPT